MMRKKFFLRSAGMLLSVMVITSAVAMNAHWMKEVDAVFLQNRLPNISYLTAFVGGMAKIATIGPMVIILDFLLSIC